MALAAAEAAALLVLRVSLSEGRWRSPTGDLRRLLQGRIGGCCGVQ